MLHKRLIWRYTKKIPLQHPTENSALTLAMDISLIVRQLVIVIRLRTTGDHSKYII